MSNFVPMSRRSNDQSIAQVLQSIFQDYRLEDKLLETQLRQRWPEITSAAVARYTDDIRLQRGILRLRFRSAPMREQFRYSAEQLRMAVNEAMGSEIVRKVEIA